ncbi:MAG TPA: phosphoribosylglycinamide formyltransferase [Bacteroidetes bacterium]|nr:phosphoribosylglycinamide formyltransferase [Bacteroidota bacterium]
MPKHIAIFASGTGTNAKKIIEHLKHQGGINVSLLVSNRTKAPALKMAAQNGVETLVINRRYFYEEKHILKIFNKYFVDYVVLAGFLWLMPTYLVNAYEKRMVNIHPALLPKYGGKGMYGMNVHKAVKAAGEKESGITIHYVNEQYDEGDIVFQKTCSLADTDTPAMIAEKVLKLEHRYFPIIIENLVNKL